MGKTIKLKNDTYIANELYSEQETIIGKWRGKTLYRKVITYITNEVIGELNTTTDIPIPHNISNLKQIVDSKLVNNNNQIFPRAYYDSNGFRWNGLINANSTYVYFRIINDTWGAKTWYITLDYIKY